jgi:arsenite/tail-anchored protein-transporting ATPase
VLLGLARTRRILFFGGKGGVGKTTVSAALATRMAAEGRRVLLVSTDPAHNLGHLFDCDIGPEPRRIAPNLDVLELDPERTVDAHLAEVGAALRRLMPERLAGEVDRHMALSRDAPGMQEAALLERIAEVVAEADTAHDLVIFDTAPSGHTARLMALPEMMSAWTEGLLARREQADRFGDLVRRMGSDTTVSDKLFGDSPDDDPRDRNARIRHLLHRRRQRFADLRQALSDAARTAFVIVLAAERLPVRETIAFHAQLERAGVEVGGLVVNKRSPADAGEFLARRREQERGYLDELDAALPQVPRIEIPLGPGDVVGLEAVHALGDSLDW